MTLFPARGVPATRAALAVVLCGSGALLGGALVSQHVFGLYPCQMCLWQRWPHGAALVVATAGLFLWRRDAGTARVMALVAVMLVALSGVIGVYHAGVEYGWWRGLSNCAAGAAVGSGDALGELLNRSVVRCDTAPWTLAGVSLAGYNAMLSLATAVLALAWGRTGPAMDQEMRPR